MCSLIGRLGLASSFLRVIQPEDINLRRIDCRIIEDAVVKRRLAIARLRAEQRGPPREHRLQRRLKRFAQTFDCASCVSAASLRA